MDNEVANKVIARAKGYCEKCGLPGDLQLHHRKLRSQGGKNEPANLIAIHASCHIQHKNSIHDNPKTSKVKGYIVPSWGDPLEYPFHQVDGTIVKLDNEGTYTRIEA